MINQPWAKRNWFTSAGATFDLNRVVGWESGVAEKKRAVLYVKTDWGQNYVLSPHDEKRFKKAMTDARLM
jgi:hypothetical protein